MALYLLPESLWVVNRTSSCMCPSLFIESYITWKWVDLECQGAGNFTEGFKINISGFGFGTAIKLYLRILMFCLISERERDHGADQPFQCLQLAITVFP